MRQAQSTRAKYASLFIMLAALALAAAAERSRERAQAELARTKVTMVEASGQVASLRDAARPALGTTSSARGR